MTDEHLSGPSESKPPPSSEEVESAPPTLPPPPQVVNVEPPTNGIAVLSLAFGIFGLATLVFVFPSVLAIVLGVIGRRNARRGAPGGAIAAWGIGLGIVGVSGVIVYAIGASM